MDNPESLSAKREIVAECTYPDYTFTVNIDGRGATYLQGTYYEPDTQTARIEKQNTRRWFLSPQMNNSEIVQTVFKCVLTSMEHRVREWFKYKGEPVFGPHFDVEALYEICKAGRFSRRET